MLFNKIKGFLQIKRAIKVRCTNSMTRFSITDFSSKENQEIVLPAFKVLLEPPDTEMSSAPRKKKTMSCATWHKDVGFLVELFFLGFFSSENFLS